MVIGGSRWLTWLVSLLVVAWLAIPTVAASQPGTAARLQVALDLGNVHQFSARDKTYSVEGTLRLSAPAVVMQRLQAAGIDPVELVRFQNQVEPWNSLLEPASGWLKLGPNLGRDYRFNGDFYSDQINYRGYPFGTLPLRLSIVPVSHANGAIWAYPFDPSAPLESGPTFSIRLQADKGNSSVSRQTNMDGYRLNDWRLVMASGAVEMQLLYTHRLGITGEVVAAAGDHDGGDAAHTQPAQQL